MSLAVVHSRAAVGILAPSIAIEVHLANGLPALNIVGLPEAAVRESKDRVRGAILTSGFEFPQRRITINLAPADLPKEGGGFDLPIALGILLASGQLKADVDRYEFVGELSLSGALRPIAGVLPMAVQARRAQRHLIVPQANGAEAALVHPDGAFGAEHLLAVCAHLSGGSALTVASVPTDTAPPPEPDLAEVRGQQHAKRALEVAAAGGHSLLLVGPPGTGKSMLAQRLPSLLPPMSEDEALECAAVRSIAGARIDVSQWRVRPFRAPHHTASATALVGGGSVPRPGEISLAHNGVLFLDELPEFDRRVLEVLREPLETGAIVISRAARQAEFPAAFQLIAAMNPCPCGYLGDPSGRCRCAAESIQRYRARISGPLLDRIDMHVAIHRVPAAELFTPTVHDTAEDAAEKVREARARQLARAGKLNCALTAQELQRIPMEESASRLLEQSFEQLRLTARSCHRILRVALTIADLAGRDRITQRDMAEAIQMRRAMLPG